MPPVTWSSTLVPGSSLVATLATGSTSISVTEHFINICGFPDDSTMVEIFKQKVWAEIADIAMLTMQEADGLLSTNSNGSYKAGF
jgi:mevalonate pyrophosphate decarboxylase